VKKYLGSPISIGITAITLVLIVFVLTFAMITLRGIPIFFTAEVTFIGCANYFATGSLFDAVVLTSMSLVLGVISITISGFLDSIVLKDGKIILKECLK